MRKLLLFKFFIGLLLAFSLPALAQEKIVSGRVTSDGGNPMSGVTVTVKGTSSVTTTNTNGDFTIRASNNQSLIFSYVDYTSREVPVGNRTEVKVNLSLNRKELDEVVVTAMDIKKTAKEVPFSVQKVEGEEIQQTQRENFVNALQGRVAGATVNISSGMAGASSQIVLRGFNSLALSNSPLFVIDGIVVDNSIVTEGGGGASMGLADNPANANRANDYSNRISVLNPNDIENVTVLKGPEATALYSRQASSGAIIITTKRPKANGKIVVSYDNSFRFESF